MSFRSQMRLYLLNSAINPSNCEDSTDLLTVSTWTSVNSGESGQGTRTTRDTQLNKMYKNSTLLILDQNRIVSHLQELGWVSDLYGLRNLQVDLWWLRRRSACPPPELNSSSTDPSSILLFRIIFQALKDLQCGRPCDMGIWVGDEPPDHKRCLASEHICYQNAERYLAELGDVECLINLSPQFLSGLVINIKKDPIFRGM